MGVVNITPDSFSDGGLYFKSAAALSHIEKLFDEGADILDIGAESSRPGAKALAPEEEWSRLEPVLNEISRRWPSALISVDTYHPQTMLRCLNYSVSIINDIRGGADFDTLQKIASRGLVYLAMHMHRDPQSMQQNALNGEEALASVSAFYKKAQETLETAGFPKEKIWLDPGIGFGKTDRANLLLLKHSVEWARHFSLVVGVSRKSFIGRLLQIEAAQERDGPSKMLELSLLLAGVKAIRTHDVLRLQAMRELLTNPG